MRPKSPKYNTLFPHMNVTRKRGGCVGEGGGAVFVLHLVEVYASNSIHEEVRFMN